MAGEQPSAENAGEQSEATEQEERRELDRQRRQKQLQLSHAPGPPSAPGQAAAPPQPADVAAEAAGLVSNPWVTLGFKLARMLGLPKWLTGKKFEIFLKYVFPVMVVFLALFLIIALVIYMYFLIKDTILGVALPSPS